jgi:uncharacterized protein YndB with AHSA1/START domain
VTAVVPSLTLVRRIKAPPAAVFEAWTRPEILALWWGPHHTTVQEAEIDARAGGQFRVVLVEQGGARHEVSGTYAEVVARERLVFSWAWTNAPERVSRVTVVFRAVPEGTEVTVTHDRFADEGTATRHRRGWTESLDRLVARFGAASDHRDTGETTP